MDAPADHHSHADISTISPDANDSASDSSATFETDVMPTSSSNSNCESISRYDPNGEVDDLAESRTRAIEPPVFSGPLSSHGSNDSKVSVRFPNELEGGRQFEGKKEIKGHRNQMAMVANLQLLFNTFVDPTLMPDEILAFPILHALPGSLVEDDDDTLYIVDTGAGAHLEQLNSLMKLRVNKRPINFITANGRIKSRGLHIKAMKLLGRTKFQVLDNTPNVLSVGRLVRENKIGFHWPLKGQPYLELENGDRIMLKVIGDVPYFSTKDMQVILASSLTPPMPNSNSLAHDAHPLALAAHANFLAHDAQLNDLAQDAIASAHVANILAHDAQPLEHSSHAASSVPEVPAMPAPPAPYEPPVGDYVGLCSWCNGRNSSIRAVRRQGKARTKLCFAVLCGDCDHYSYDDVVAIPGIAVETAVNDTVIDIADAPSDASTAASDARDPSRVSARIRRRVKGPPSLEAIVNSEIPLEKMSKQAIRKYADYCHEILHLHGNGKCDICNVAKQRRARHSPVLPKDAIYELKLYGKTSFDTVESGMMNLCTGVGGLVYATAIRDEASTFAHFEAHRKKNFIAVGHALRDYFGKDAKLAGGFYCDGAKAFKKVAEILGVPIRSSKPRTQTSNSRMESWMRVLGDGARTLLYSAGLSLAWWPFAYNYYCLAHNILNVNPRNGKTPYQMRFPKHNPITLHPFGCRVTYVPYIISNGKNGEPMAQERGLEGILLGYYVPPGEPATKEAIIAPLSNFTKTTFNFKVIRSRDYRFHGISYPLRKLREQAQFVKYQEVNPTISEDDYRSMIFGTQSGHNEIRHPVADAM